MDTTPRTDAPTIGWRALVAQTPALVVATVALALSVGGVAYASNTLATGPRVTTTVTLHPLTLQNGWVSSNGTFGSGNPKVGLSNGVVYLAGSLNQPSAASAVFATLPSTYRPNHNLWITVYTFGGTSGTLYIGKNGTMEAFSSTSCGSLNAAQCYTSLASVSYPKSS